MAVDQDELFNKKVTIIETQLIQSILIILSALLVPILSVLCKWYPEGESVGSWFQRSGSLVVMLTIWAEYKLFSINSEINPTGIVISKHTEIKNKYKKPHIITSYCALTLAILGTIIWGYGDLLL